MKYSEKEFNSAVEDYKSKVKSAKGKDFFILFDITHKDAFYSIAPLSRALHELGSDVCCLGMYKNSDSYNAIGEIWIVYQELKSGLDNEQTRALKDFIDEVDKKAKGEFEKIFAGPDFFLEARKGGFSGSMDLPFRTEWFNDYRMEELMETSEILWRDVYALKKGERVGIGLA